MSSSTNDVAGGKENKDGLELTNINVLPVDKTEASQKVSQIPQLKPTSLSLYKILLIS